MREFGAEQLSARTADELRARHRDYYLGLAEQAATQTLSPAQVSWMTRLREETDNLRVALDWSLRAAGQGAAGLRMTVLLRTYWLMTGMFTEGRTWHERVMAVRPGTRDNAWAVYGTGILAVQQGDLAEGAPLLERAAGLATELSDKDLATHITEAQGMVAFYAGDLETAFARHTEALAVYEESGFSDAVALSGYARLASVCLLNLDIARAAELCEEYLRRCDEAGEQWGRGTALWTRGAARWLAGENEAAVTDALDALRIKETLGDLHTMTMCFDLLAVCAAALGQFERAAVLYGVGDTFWKVLNAPIRMGPGYSDIRRNAGETALANLGQERYETAYQYGLALSLAEAITIARGKQPDLPARIQAVKPLTRREKEIGRLVAAGLGNREIAERLYLSKRTVDSHLEHIFAKLGFSSRTQLANWILEHPDL
ncbi:MAG: response regulator transcription factor, partial [Trebonia sp.]